MYTVEQRKMGNEARWCVMRGEEMIIHTSSHTFAVNICREFNSNNLAGIMEGREAQFHQVWPPDVLRKIVEARV